MKSTREYITFFLILLILTPFAVATGSEPTNGGDSDISIGHEYTGLKDFIKQIFTNPFSTVGAQTNVWVADRFTIGEFNTVRIDITNERYTFNHGDNLKILAFFKYPRGQNIRVKIFKIDKLDNNKLILNYDTQNYDTPSWWTWAYWKIDRNNVQAGTYVIRSYINDQQVVSKQYVVKPLPPTVNMDIGSMYQVDEEIQYIFSATKGSVNIHSYKINYGDGTEHIKTINSARENVELTHIYEDAGTYDIVTTVIDSELNEYASTKEVEIVLAGVYSDDILEADEYYNIGSDDKTDVEFTLTPNLERYYTITIDDEIIFSSTERISEPQQINKPLELEMGKHHVAVKSSYNGVNYATVFDGIIYAKYIPEINYNTNYQDTISGTLEHNEALIDTEILLYKNGMYETKTNTVNGYFSFSGLTDGVYNIVFNGNDEYIDISSENIDIGDTEGIEVKTINLNQEPTVWGYIGSIMAWFKNWI